MVTRRVLVALALLLLAAPPALGRTLFLDPAPPTGVPAPASVPELEERAEDLYAGATGERLDREEVDVAMDLDFRDLDFDALGVVFGGGSFRADARLTARLDFHVLSVGRVQDSVEDAVGRPVDLPAYGLDARDQYLTADAFRATLAGEALAAFQDEQEARVVKMVTESFPDVTVLQSYATWSNTSVASNARGDEPPRPDHPAPRTDARDPPVTLVTVVELQYHKRQSLLGLLDGAWGSGLGGGAEDAGTPAPQDRSAFALFGLRQPLRLDAPPGWDVLLRLRLPEGFTFEEASPDVLVDDSLREAHAVALARESGETVPGPASVTLGSRYLVSVAMLGAVLLAGALVRVPAILVANRLFHPKR